MNAKSFYLEVYLVHIFRAGLKPMQPMRLHWASGGSRREAVWGNCLPPNVCGAPVK